MLLQYSSTNSAQGFWPCCGPPERHTIDPLEAVNFAGDWPARNLAPRKSRQIPLGTAILTDITGQATCIK